MYRKLDDFDDEQGPRISRTPHNLKCGVIDEKNDASYESKYYWWSISLEHAFRYACVARSCHRKCARSNAAYCCNLNERSTVLRPNDTEKCRDLILLLIWLCARPSSMGKEGIEAVQG
jgi:hypothetical protein